MRRIQRNDKVLVITDRGPAIGRVSETLSWQQLGGHSATKHCTISTAVHGWGYRVSMPMYGYKDGSVNGIYIVPAAQVVAI